MTEAQAPAAPPGPLERYGLTLVTIASFAALTFLARMFYPFLPYFLVAALTIGTVAAAPRLPRLEAGLSRWLLTVAFVAMTAVTLSTLPPEVHPNDGPRCPGSGPPLCAELKEWWDAHLRARGQHERGIAVLGWSSLIAAGVLAGRLSQVRTAAVPRDRRPRISAVPDALSRVLSIVFLGLNGLVLWAVWFVVAFEMRES
ncbi:MAG: hypothetical protein OXH41_08565 [Chloroflexi bacterium]|nr:hypothetical protein [Chloroflexota bacterium]